MIIALDFDGTVTADPAFWCEFVCDAVAFGHEVITVTHRRDIPENRAAIAEILGADHPVIFAYDKPKKLAAIEAGYEVSVFIDDNPVGIGDGTERLATQSVFEIELRNAWRVLKWQSGNMDRIGLELLKRLETVLGDER